MSAEEKSNDNNGSIRNFAPVFLVITALVVIGVMSSNDKKNGYIKQKAAYPDNNERKPYKFDNNQSNKKQEQHTVTIFCCWLGLLIYFTLVSICVPAIWTNAEEGSWYLAFIGLVTLFLSLCAYAYDNLISDKEPGAVVRVMKVMGDVGAAIVVLGTVKALIDKSNVLEPYTASAFVVVILAITAYKTYKEI